MYEDRILAFVDVLGFSNAIKKTIQDDGTENYNETQKIDNILNDVHWQLNYKDLLVSNELPIGSKVTSQFSDSIIISYLKTEEIGIYRILLDIYLLCVTALQNNFLLRGAIVCGKLYHKKNRIFGPALVKAVKMEENIAKCPRIILEKNITTDSAAQELLLCDTDGFFFINYFNKLKTGVDDGFEQMLNHFYLIRDVIKDMKTKNDCNVKSKYIWIKKKFNNILKKLNINYNSDIVKSLLIK